MVLCMKVMPQYDGHARVTDWFIFKIITSRTKLLFCHFGLSDDIKIKRSSAGKW
jgi:hypothetical protein